MRGLLAYRDLDDALGLTALAGGMLAESRTGRNGWHGIAVSFASPSMGVSPATRMSTTPTGSGVIPRCAGSSAARRSIAGGEDRPARWAGSRPSCWPNNENLAALADLSGMWIDQGSRPRSAEARRARHGQLRQPTTFGEQKGTAYNGQLRLHLLSPAVRVQTSSAGLERCALRPSATFPFRTAPTDGVMCLVPVVERYKASHPPLLPRRCGVGWKPQEIYANVVSQAEGCSTPSGCPPTRCSKRASLIS